MYTETDYAEAKKNYMLVILAVAVFTLVMGALIALCFIGRKFFLTFLLTTVWWFAVTFYYGMRGVYIVRYKRFLDEAAGGLHHGCEGVLQEARDPFWFDNLEVREYVFLRDDGFERKLYYDALKPEPGWKMGDRVVCETFGSFITSIKTNDGV